MIPWIGWDVATRAAITIMFWYLFLLFFGGAGVGRAIIAEIFDAPPSAGFDPTNHIVFGVLLVIILGPFIATPFVAAVRGTRFAFGSEGLVAASTVRVRPSRAPPWDDNKTCRVKYPPNKSIRGYRHSFFYSDEHVIDDVATWIQRNGQNAGCAVWRAAKERTAVQAFVLRWFVPAVASIAMIASFSWSTLAEIRALSGVKFDLASDTSPIRGGAAPVLEVDRNIKGAVFFPPPPGPFSLETAVGRCDV